MRPFRSFGRGDGMDEYLMSEGLWRKTVPKDETSLYRAVAEQVFNTQAFHENVRSSCDHYIEGHRTQLLLDWNGPIEIKALSVLYERDFLVYQHVGRPPINVTCMGFRCKVRLCLSAGNHYDSVYSRSFMEAAAMSQSILYELLYDNVFGVENSVMKGQEMISSKPIHYTKHSSITAVDKQFITDLTSEDKVAELTRTPQMVCRSTPFPYKVAKSLSPDMFRNVEYDAWLESKKNEQLPRTVKSGVDAGFIPGDKCQVILEGEESRMLNGHIQEILPGGDTAVVYIEEIGRRQMLQLNKLVALPRTFYIDTNWKKKGKKKVCECAKGVFTDSVNLHITSTKTRSGLSTTGHRTRINSAGHPIKMSHNNGHRGGAASAFIQPRQSCNSLLLDKDHATGQTIKLLGRQRYNSEGHYGESLDTRYLEDPLELYRNDESGYKDQQYDESSHNTTEFEGGPNNEEITGDQLTLSDMSHSESEISEDRSALLLSSMAKGSPTSNCINGHSFQTMEVLSTPSTMLHHQLLTPLPPGYMTAMQYHNLVIPVPDNFNGPINTNVSPSIEPNGRDLPVHDHSTMRFFFNIGVQYYRMSYLLQPSHQPQQHAMPFITFPVNNTAGVCVTPVPQPPSAIISTTPDIFAVNDDDFGSNSYGCGPAMSPTSGTFYFSSASAAGIPPFFQFPGAMPFI